MIQQKVKNNMTVVLGDSLKKYLNKAVVVLCAIFSVVLQYAQLQSSCYINYLAGSLRTDSLQYLIFNILVLLLISLVLSLIFRKWWCTLLATDILFSVWSVANYYTIQFHGDPLFPSEFANITTAAAVLGNYRFTIGRKILVLEGLFAVELVIVLFIRKLERGDQNRRRYLQVRILLMCLAWIFLSDGLFGYNPIKSRNAVSWSWEHRVGQYGFVLACVSNIDLIINRYQKPENYEEMIAGIPIAIPTPEAETVSVDTYPDIIVILNETFYDLGFYPGISGTDFFDDFYSIENAVCGKALVPGTGGGTNRAEFELLTSHSMRLMKDTAPFNYVDFRVCDDNAVNYLKYLGYRTVAMHNAVGTNYRRNVQYPAMGFEQVLFRDDFIRQTYYGSRYALDADDYLELEDVRINMGEDTPKLIYLLTLQNHGGFEQNDPDWDLIHTDDDLGDLTDDVDEYLTSVSMSVSAFRGLVEYYETVNHPVAILMVGDHAPSFIKNLTLPVDGEWDETFMARLVPYVIWANFPLTIDGLYTDYASVVDLLPMLLRMCSMPTSPYYDLILDLHNLLPIRSKEGAVIDRDGKVETIDTDHPAWEKISQYYAMEYAALTKDTAYYRGWYEMR